METLTVPPISGAVNLLAMRTPKVYVDGARRHDLVVMHWRREVGPDLDSCRLGVIDMLDARPVEDDLWRLPPDGATVTLVDECAGAWQGVVSRRWIQWGSPTEVAGKAPCLLADVRSRVAATLDRPIFRCWRLCDGAAVATAGTLRLNDGLGTWAAHDSVDVGGRDAKLFATGPQATRWTAAAAINYLLATEDLAGLTLPSAAEVESLCGGIELGEMDLSHKTLGEALCAIAGRAGLALKAVSDQTGLVLYHPGSGRRRQVQLQPAGMACDAAASNLLTGSVSFTSRPAVRGVTCLGEQRQYESTFQLLPLWDRNLEGQSHRQYSRSRGGDWPAMADVFRRWGLNEHGWYCDEPWGLPRHSFDGLGGEDFPLAAARRFMPCLSVDDCGQSLGVVVEVRCDHDGPWRRWTQPVWISPGECSIYLGGDSLEAEFFQAAVAGTAAVRVTAVVASDRRVTVELPAGEGNPTDVLDLWAQAAWRSVHASSVFHSTHQPGGQRDDTAAMLAIAKAHQQKMSAAVSGELRLAWADTGFDAGDVVERIDGRCIGLSSSLGRPVSIAAVRHDFQDWQTILSLQG